MNRDRIRIFADALIAILGSLSILNTTVTTLTLEMLYEKGLLTLTDCATIVNMFCILTALFLIMVMIVVRRRRKRAGTGMTRLDEKRWIPHDEVP